LTDAIFEQLERVHQQAEADPTTLRLSLDAKATVKVGPFSRGGKTRVETQACDHDFKPLASLTPYGIFLPDWDELFLYFTASKVTSDFMVDVLEAWWQSQQQRFCNIKTLLLNQDNGPENHSRRTQWMERLVEFSQRHGLNLRLAYYPPYHSKYNPIERTWGVLENHWNGNLLDEITTVLRFAQSMTWNGVHPTVTLVTQTYQTGVKLTKQAMAEVENQLHRLTSVEVQGEPVNLGKWFIDIFYNPTPKTG
jgi:Rhodopirellula transposase DDE domain